MSSLFAFVDLNFCDATIDHHHHAIRHLGNRGVVCNDNSQGAKLMISPSQCVEDDDTGFDIQCTGWLISK